jgi:BioD-like phosphotransacetylase family protein
MLGTSWRTRGSVRTFSSGTSNSKHSAVYITDVDGNVVSHHPLLLGLVNYFERHLPYVGYFAPIGGTANVDSKNTVDAQLRLVHGAFEQKQDIRSMFGVPADEATRMIAAGKTADMMDQIYSAYAAYKDMNDVVVVQGTDVGAEDMDSQIAAALGTPAIITVKWHEGNSVSDVHTKLLLKRQALAEHKVGQGGGWVRQRGEGWRALG